jgi:hypothetical protein
MFGMAAMTALVEKCFSDLQTFDENGAMKYGDESIMTCGGMTYCRENDIKKKLDEVFGTIIVVIISISSQPCGGGNFLVAVILSWREVTGMRNVARLALAL